MNNRKKSINTISTKTEFHNISRKYRTKNNIKLFNKQKSKDKSVHLNCPSKFNKNSNLKP